MTSEMVSVVVRLKEYFNYKIINKEVNGKKAGKI